MKLKIKPKSNEIEVVDKIYNEDCLKTVQDRLEPHSVDCVITSPPYNTGRANFNARAINNHEGRYKEYNDNRVNEEYIEWICEIVCNLDRVLKKDGSILLNLSYGGENTECMFLLVGELIKNTPFTIADCLVWKKASALPNNVSKNKLTRICEFVFVLCRKTEFKTFNTNKQVASVNSKTGQKFYEVFYNYIEAPNNDGSCNLNKATFSTKLVTQLIDMYCTKGSTIYDPFIGTGTTAVGCVKKNCHYIGSEISEEQCDFARERIKKVVKNETNIKSKKE